MKNKKYLLAISILAVVLCTMFFSATKNEVTLAYAQEIVQSEIMNADEETGLIQYSSDPRVDAFSSLTGDFTNIIIYFKFKDEVVDPAMNFYDQPFDESINKTLNTSPISVRKYFQVNSLGKINYSAFLVSDSTTFLVAEAPQSRTYYMPINQSNPSGYDSQQERTIREMDLVTNVVTQVDTYYVNNYANLTEEQIDSFNSLDSNSDGDIDALTLMYLNYGTNKTSSSWEDLLWPHAWVSSGASINGKEINNFNFIAQDRILQTTGTTIENFGVVGNSSTICHEMAHILGMPDLYSYMDVEDEEERPEDAVSTWCLMAQNHSPNPQYLNTYMRYAIGWLENKHFKEITINGNYSLKPVSFAEQVVDYSMYNQPVGYYIRGQGDYSNQLIVFEYREKNGSFDGKQYTSEYGIVDNGLIIYRVDLDVITMPGYGGSCCVGNNGNDPYNIYVFRPEEEGSEGDSVNAAFKNNATFGTATGLTNAITFQDYDTAISQDQIKSADITYVNSTIIASQISIVESSINFTISSEFLYDTEDDVPVPILNDGNGIEDSNLYNKLLSLRDSQIDPVLYSKDLINLTTLDLHDCNIASLKGISKVDLKNVERLILDGNQITSGLDELVSFTKLKILQAANMGLTSIDFVPFLYDVTMITSLDLSRNKIVDFSPLTALTSLEICNIMFNYADESVLSFASNSAFIIGAQNITKKFSIGGYSFNFYTTTKMFNSYIDIYYGYKQSVSVNQSTTEMKVNATTYQTTSVTKMNYINTFRVDIKAGNVFYYLGCNYTIYFYNYNVSVDKEIDVRYVGEGTFTTDGVTYDTATYPNVFTIIRTINRYEESGAGDPILVETVDINTVGRYEIKYTFTNKVDATQSFEIIKWIYILSNDVITREVITDENLYAALLDIVNAANSTSLSVLHSQDIARIEGYTDLNLSGCNIASLDGINSINLENITFINLNDNQITSLIPINNLAGLLRLFARNNKLVNIETLTVYQRAEYIDLSFNLITDAKPAQSLVTSSGNAVKRINLNMNFIDLEDSENAYLLQDDIYLLLIQCLQADASYIDSTGFQFYQFSADGTPITEGVSIKFKRDGLTQTMTNSNYISTKDGSCIVTIKGEASSIFGSFSVPNYTVQVTLFTLAPLTYLEEKFLIEEDNILVKEYIKVPQTSDITRSNSNITYQSSVSISDNFSNFSTNPEDETYICFNITSEVIPRTVNTVIYTVTTYFKNTSIICQTKEIKRDIIVINNIAINILDDNLRAAVLTLAGKETGEDVEVYKYDLYKISDLNLSNKGVVNLYGIDELMFKNLTVLRLNNNNIKTTGSNTTITLLRAFPSLKLIDLSRNEIEDATGVNLFVPDEELTIILYLNKLNPAENCNRYAYSRIGDLDPKIKLVVGLQCVSEEMKSFNSNVKFYYNPLNVTLANQKFSLGTTGKFNEETWTVYFDTPIEEDTAIFSYVYGIEVSIVYTIKIARGQVTIANNTVDVEVYNEFIDEELIYEGIDKSEYNIINVQFRAENEITKSNVLKNTVLASYEQTFTVVLKSTNQAYSFSKQVNVVDTTAPVINLIGDSYIRLETGDEYEEFGIAVNDNYYKEFQIVKFVPLSIDVDTYVKGVYTLDYYAVDASGNTSATIHRIVEVDYHDFLRCGIKGGEPLVYVGVSEFEAYYQGLKLEDLGFDYTDPNPTMYWYVNGELTYVSHDKTFAFEAPTAGKYMIELRINDKLQNSKVCSTELIVMFDDEVIEYTIIGGSCAFVVLIAAVIAFAITRKKRRELYNDYSNETYRGRRKWPMKDINQG